MANRYPLQSGDRAPNFSGRDSSTAADRRPPMMHDMRNDRPVGNTWDPEEDYNGVSPEFGEHRAPQASSPASGTLLRHGTPESDSRWKPPFQATDSPEGTTTEVREIDICQYGDAYDPKSPVRVRVVDWNVDTDYDGEPN